MKSILEIRNLEKSFKGKKALDGISFQIFEGELLCLLGPNGAGKSTVINILSTALGYDGGEIYFDGKRIGKNNSRSSNFLKENMGIVPQDLAIYEELSAEANIRFFASLYGLKGGLLKQRVEEALEFAGLKDKRKDKVKTFSGGMKRRLNIACAITHKPRLIIMDEPTVGIDPQSRNHIQESIVKLRKNGATILYTTHYMEEVEEISTRILIMDHGRLIAEGTNEQLKESLQNEKIYSMGLQEVKHFQKEEFYRIEGVKNVELEENKLKITTMKGVENLDRLIAFAVERGLRINNLVCEEASLETVFLKLTGRSLRD